MHGVSSSFAFQSKNHNLHIQVDVTHYFCGEHKVNQTKFITHSLPKKLANSTMLQNICNGLGNGLYGSYKCSQATLLPGFYESHYEWMKLN